MCGENFTTTWMFWFKAGSPPHVRGKLSLAEIINHMTGITPACAGKTDDDCQQHDLHEDHPRMCGENSTMSGWNALA